MNILKLSERIRNISFYGAGNLRINGCTGYHGVVPDLFIQGLREFLDAKREMWDKYEN